MTNQFEARNGSALILTVVLTTLLAVVAVTFLLVSRIDNIATTAVSESRELEFAARSVVAAISDQLVLDVPGVSGEEYHDYPGVLDRWLADLEPYDANEGTGTAPDYRWRQISDVTGYLANRNFATTRIPIQLTTNANDPNGQFYAIIPDRKPLVLDANGVLEDQFADADGDGVVDSKWVMLHGLNSNKNHAIFAAVRIIDNGAMLNLNTGFKFVGYDPNAPAADVDGSSLLHVNLMGLSWRQGQWLYNPLKEWDLLMARSNYGVGVDPNNLRLYEANVAWRYESPVGLPGFYYTPFDISDELELRNRFCVNHTGIDTRIEELGNNVGRSWDFRTIRDHQGPVDNPAQLYDWFNTVYTSGMNGTLVDPNIDPNYTYRHIATVHNMERMINPRDPRMPLVNNGLQACVNHDRPRILYDVIRAALYAGGQFDPNGTAAQLAANIVDYRDTDANVTIFTPMVGPNAVTYYGFESQPFISEIGYRVSAADPNNPANNYFAVELYNPFLVDIPLADFTLQIRQQNGPVVGDVDFGTRVIAPGGRFVVANNSRAMNNFGLGQVFSAGRGSLDPNLIFATYEVDPTSPPQARTYILSENFDLQLVRRTIADPNALLALDRQQTQASWFTWQTNRDQNRYQCRADNNWNILYQQMVSTATTLGGNNRFANGTKRNYNLGGMGRGFATVGDITRVLTVGPSNDPNDMIGVRVNNQPSEGAIRFDVMDDPYAGIFQYVTAFDPNSDTIDNDSDSRLDAQDMIWPEWKIPGRININTAPWYVIAQLPYMQRNLPWVDSALAKEIVRFRNPRGFENIGLLAQVPRMNRYATGTDLTTYPDLTPSDGVGDDFEQRDVIFSRISNLATVRSDVFTAYILVRIGIDGAQKRVMVILDRSDVYAASDKVRIRAYQVVPDPR